MRADTIEGAVKTALVTHEEYLKVTVSLYGVNRDCIDVYNELLQAPSGERCDMAMDLFLEGVKALHCGALIDWKNKDGFSVTDVELIDKGKGCVFVTGFVPLACL